MARRCCACPLLLFGGRRLADKTGLLKRLPFEVLFVASAWDASPRTLLAGRLCLVALEPFRLAGNAAIAALGLLSLGDGSTVDGLEEILRAVRRGLDVGIDGWAGL